MPTRARAGNLTAALVLVAAMELLLNRLANRLFLPRSLVSGGGAGATLLARIVGDSGPFLFHLTGVLALALLALAMRGLLRRRELFPGPAVVRLAVSAIALGFCTLAMLAMLIGRVPRGFVLPLEAGFGFLSLLTAGAFLRSSAPPRVKLGVVLFALPAALHVAAAILAAFGWVAVGPAGGLAVWSEASLILAAASAPFTVGRASGRASAKDGRLGWMIPLALAAAMTAILSVVLKTRYDLMQAIALYGPHLEMPRLTSWVGLAYLAATLGWCYAVARLLAERGGARLAAYGLLLLAIGGYPLGSPVELSVSLVGLLSLSVGELRLQGRRDSGSPDDAPALSRAEWRAWIGQLAKAAHDGSVPAVDVGPPEAVVVEEDNLEASRIRAHRRGHGLGIRFLRRRGRITEVDITVGDPGHREPSATIERHRGWLARSPEQRLPLPRSKTGDPTFDQRFSVHGEARLESELVRRGIMERDDGLYSVWNGTAARYQATTGVADAAVFLALLDLLIDLMEAGTPAPGA
jgi:hypothetical protein